MQTKIIIGLVLIVGIALFAVWYSSEEPRSVETVLVEDPAYQLSFNYLNGIDGYELIESETSDSFLQSYVMVEKSALADFQAEPDTLAPPTISIFMFDLPETETPEGEEQPGRITRLQSWAQENASLTAFDSIYGTPDIVEIDGVRALEYTTDGLYQQTVYLVSYRGVIYMFLSQYERPTDVIKQDFETLMQTVRFE